jgi:hypothetical protein
MHGTMILKFMGIILSDQFYLPLAVGPVIFLTSPLNRPSTLAAEWRQEVTKNIGQIK